MSKLLKLKEWLTLPDAARHLSMIFEEEVSEADILMLALDGRLRLSVRFLHPNAALCGTITTVEDPSECFDPRSGGDDAIQTLDDASEYVDLEDRREDAIERAKRILIDQQDNLVLDIESELYIDGIWDLMMRGGSRAYVEDQIQTIIKGPGVYPFCSEEGVYLVKEVEEEVKACRLRPEHPDGGIPNDSHLVVRTAALKELEENLSAAEKSKEKPLRKRERDTLHLIIAALADIAKLDLNHPSAAANAIEHQTELQGARVAARTIENHLNSVREAREDRG